MWIADWAQDCCGEPRRAGGRTDSRSLFLHHLPLVGRFVRARLNGSYVRDETLQARELPEPLSILDAAGVDGAFVATFDLGAEGGLPCRASFYASHQALRAAGAGRQISTRRKNSTLMA